MQLAESPFWEHALFESPWVLAAVLLVAAAALFWHAVQRDDRRARRLAPVLAVIAAGLWLLSSMVTTTRETIADQTRQLVEATSPFDRQALEQLFDDQAAVMSADGAVMMNDRSLMLIALGRAIEFYKVQGHRVSVAEIDLDGNRARTRFVVRTALGGEYRGRPVRTEWLVTWVRGVEGGYLAQSIQWIDLNGQDPPPGIIW